MERRHCPQKTSRVTLEKRSDSSTAIVGLAAVYYDGTLETEYELWKGTVERIMPGAFDVAIKQNDTRGLFNHDPNNLLGRQSAGTLKLASVDRGLQYEIDAADTTVSRDVQEHVRRNDLQGSSFSFRITDERWHEDGDTEVREILAVELFDVGPVTFPAYDSTTTGLRSAGTDEAQRSYDRWKAGRADAGRRRAVVETTTRLAEIEAGGD